MMGHDSRYRLDPALIQSVDREVFLIKGKSDEDAARGDLVRLERDKTRNEKWVKSYHLAKLALDCK
jgi:hypothetical protein